MHCVSVPPDGQGLAKVPQPLVESPYLFPAATTVPSRHCNDQDTSPGNEPSAECAITIFVAEGIVLEAEYPLDNVFEALFILI